MTTVLSLVIYSILMGGHFAAEPLRWRVLFENSCTWPFSKWFHLHNVTALLSYLLPAKLGIPLRIALIKQQTQLSISIILKGLGIDAAIYYSVWSVIAAVLVACSPVLRTCLRSIDSRVLIGSILILVVLALFLRIARRSVTDSARPKSMKSPARLLTALRALADVPQKRLFLILGVVLFDLLAEGLRQTCLAMALGISVPVLTMMQIGIVGFAAGLFSFLPMGLGAYDAVVILLLSGSDVAPGQFVGLLAGNRLGLIAFSGFLGPVGAFQLGFRPAHLKDLRDLILRRTSEPPLGPSEI